MFECWWSFVGQTFVLRHDRVDATGQCEGASRTLWKKQTCYALLELGTEFENSLFVFVYFAYTMHAKTHLPCCEVHTDTCVKVTKRVDFLAMWTRWYYLSKGIVDLSFSFITSIEGRCIYTNDISGTSFCWKLECDRAVGNGNWGWRLLGSEPRTEKQSPYIRIALSKPEKCKITFTVGAGVS